MTSKSRPRRTLSDIKTVVRSKIRAMPKTTGAETLEKFILEKNRARLGQERTNIEKRLEHIDNEISLIEGEIEELNDKDQQNEDTIINSVNNKKQEYHKKMKRMSMDY